MVKKDNLVVALDIGTTKVRTLIGEIQSGGTLDVIGVGSSFCNGLQKGNVVNLDSTVESIKHALEEAELMSGIKVDSAYVGIAGSHIRGINSRGVVAVSGKNKEISQYDIDRVLDAAQAVAIPADRNIIHILPHTFIVDDQEGIRDPLGMFGVRLEAEVHIVTGAMTAVQNIVKSVELSRLSVDGIIMEQLASADATLTQEEKELGVAVLDIGGGTSDLAIFIGGNLWHSSVLALGGNHLSKDIAFGLRTSYSEAEKIKVEYGSAISSAINPQDTLKIQSVGGRKSRDISRRELAEIIEPRCEEIFSLINQELLNTGMKGLLGAGIVVTGGCSLMPKMQEIAEQLIEVPVRIGSPTGVSCLTDTVNSPIYSTGVGLLLYGASFKTSKDRYMSERSKGGGFKKVVNWFKNFF